MENKQNIKDLIQKFYPYAKETLGFEHPVRVIMRQDAENAQNSLGKTAYYDPAEKLIVLYITDRHPKDVLSSFSHELVHHAQNCRGELDDLITGGHYAENGIGREIESEAYLQGNLNVRDWENSPQGIELKGVNEMKMTKSQLKGIVEAAIKQMTEGFPDLTGDGEVTQADILKARGVELKEEDLDEQAPPKPKLPSNWRSLPADDPARIAYRDWMRKYGPKAKSSLPAKDAKDIAKELGSPALSKVTDGGKDFGAELAARADGTYKDPKMVAKAKSMAGELGDLYKKTGAMDVDMDKALAKAQGVDIVGDPMEIAAISDEDKEKAIQAMERGSRAEQQAAAIIRMLKGQPTAKQKAAIEKRMDLFQDLAQKIGATPQDNLAAKLKSATDDEPTQVAPAGAKSSLPFKESNDTWYQGTLYERLVTKWTK